MSDPNQTVDSGQGQPAGVVQTDAAPGQLASTIQSTQHAAQGLMGMAKVAPSGTEYKSYDPVDVKHAEARNGG
jgi:hypothetical protein